MRAGAVKKNYREPEPEPVKKNKNGSQETLSSPVGSMMI